MSIFLKTITTGNQTNTLKAEIQYSGQVSITTESGTEVKVIGQEKLKATLTDMVEACIAIQHKRIELERTLLEMGFVPGVPGDE